MFGRKQRRYVEVNFREFTDHPNLQRGHGYVYVWSAKEDPQESMRVWVPAPDGPKPAVICDANAPMPPGFTHAQLKPVSRIASESDLASAQNKWLAERNAWADIVRKVAGLPTSARPRRQAPEGFPDVPPAQGKATQREADTYGRGWWGIYKRAEKEGWDPSEVDRYKEIAKAWFTVRDNS